MTDLNYNVMKPDRSVPSAAEAESMNDELQIKELEKQVDLFFSSLDIRHYPRNLAQWSVLTGAALQVQKAATAEYGGAKHRTATINCSRVAALLLDQISKKGNQRYATQQSFLWSDNISMMAYRALKETEGYFLASACFPYWHQNRFAAEVCGNHICFKSQEGPREKQIKAFQKGIVRKAIRTSPENSLAPMTSARAQLFEKVLASCGGTKSMRLRYAVPKDLYFDLLPWFQAQAEALVRRRDEIDLGFYTMGQVKAFLAALQTICAAHDHLCFLAGSRSAFPLNSAVLSKTRKEWVFELSMLSELGEATLQNILNDLTFGNRAPIDLHSELFVPLNQQGNVLGIVPQFGLSARVDENLLRTLARTNEKRHSKVSDTKESEMVDELRGSSSMAFTIKGPYELPKEAQTNLDLVVVDEASSTVLVAELKWIRKPAFVKERIRADEEFLKGLGQIAKLKSFLSNNTSYLKTRGVLCRDLSEYAHIHFVLVGRDHLTWRPPDVGSCIVEYDILKGMLRDETDLNSIYRELNEYNWLPVDGVDFEIKTNIASVNGVTIEGDAYFSL